ncbi:MAG TPA: B12-binding domain-containing protein [Ktedonobacterales bacterium]
MNTGSLDDDRGNTGYLGRNSGPLRALNGPLGGGSGALNGDPPNLTAYPPDPVYELATIVLLVGARPMTLWSWEQQLGIPRPARQGDGTGSTVRHYSERDLIACVWLRNQILAGVTPADAAARLLSAQPPGVDPFAASSDGESSGQGPHGMMNTGPIGRPTITSGPFGLGVSGRLSGPLNGLPGSLGPGIGRPGAPGALPPGSPSRPSWGPLTNPDLGGQASSRRGPASGPLRAPGSADPASLPGAHTSGSWSVPPATPPGRQGTGALDATTDGQGARPWAAGTPDAPVGASRPVTSSGVWATVSGAGTGGTATRELRSLVPQLVRAFATFDTALADRIVDEAMAGRPMEVVCIGLLQPALTRVGEMWAKHQFGIPEEHFAANYIRGRLFALFVGLQERYDAPMAIVACGPKETHDIGALMLALFWRKVGLRVIFLGQDVDGPALVQDVRMRRPQIVCVSIATPQRIRAVARMARDIAQIEAPRPIFTFGGAAFAHNTSNRHRVMGVYLGDDAATATWHVTRLLGLDHGSSGPPPYSPIDQVG